MHSLNPVIQNKTQMYGYQRYSIPDNRYISKCNGKKKFPVLPLGWYLFGIVNGSMYLPRFINVNVLCISTIGTEFVAVVTLPFFWILSWFTEFADLSEIHLGETVIIFLVFSNCDVAEYWYFITISQSYCGLGWNFVNCSQISPLHTSYFVWGKSPYRYKMTHVQPKTLPETRIPFQLVMINLNYKTILNRKGPQVVSLVMWLMYLVQATARQVKCHPWECEICVNCLRMWRMRRKMWLRLSWRFWRWN